MVVEHNHANACGYRGLELDKRLEIEDLVAIIAAGVAAIGATNSVANYISALIKQQSDANTCGVISGYVDG